MNQNECNDIIRNWEKTVAEWETKTEAASISELPTHVVIGGGMTSVIKALSASRATFVTFIDDNKLWTSNSATIAERVREWVNDAYAYAAAESDLADAIQALTEITEHRSPEATKGIADAIAHFEEAHTNLCAALVQNGYRGSW